MASEASLSLEMPKVRTRTAAALALSLSRGGKEVFRDVKPIAIIAPDADGLVDRAGTPKAIAVIDQGGTVAARLGKLGLASTACASASDIPKEATVLIVGPNALDQASATSTAWMAFAARGGKALVLDQDVPLHGAALPADMAPTDRAGRVAFSENLAHPAFAGLDQADFFTWAPDEMAYRNIYSKPTKGAISLADCDEQLAYSALAECRVNDGILMVCQLEVGSKLASNPVAQKLFDNLVAYCAGYTPLRKHATTFLAADTPRGKLLESTGLLTDRGSDPVPALSDGKSQILVVDATPARLSALASAKPALDAFTAKGGWLVLWGVTPEGLKSFDAIVGVEHVMRPFRRERVTLPGVRDPLASGLTMRDVVMDSGQVIAPWSGQRFASADSYTYVVDYDDIAPFCAYPAWQYFNPGRKGPDPDKDPCNLVNGFTNADDWRYIFQLPAQAPFLEWDITLPRAEKLSQLDIINNGNYRLLTSIELTPDGDAKRMMAVPIKPAKDAVQSFALGETATRLHVKLAAWTQSQAPGVIGIDNWWIRVARSKEFYDRVKPLLNIGALVRYPMGAGGVLLCELNVPDQEANPENGPKRVNLVATLLRNLGGVFAGGRTIVAGGGLAYHPVPLGERCNLFLTRAQGWFDGEAADLAALPVGPNRFAGVDYEIRDVRTSPLPAAISLEGPNEKTALAKSVSGIPVGRTAAALFFLHASRQTAGWQAPNDGDKTPPALWCYTVHYADGKSETVPVRLGLGTGAWRVGVPQGFGGCEVAWSAPIAGANDHAVAYQMQWTNPRPQVAISAIDVAYDPAIGATAMASPSCWASAPRMRPEARQAR